MVLLGLAMAAVVMRERARGAERARALAENILAVKRVKKEEKEGMIGVWVRRVAEGYHKSREEKRCWSRNKILGGEESKPVKIEIREASISG